VEAKEGEGNGKSPKNKGSFDRKSPKMLQDIIISCNFVSEKSYGCKIYGCKKVKLTTKEYEEIL
jgi:hypothetical protein